MISNEHVFSFTLYVLAWWMACLPAICGIATFFWVREVRRCNGEVWEYAAPAVVFGGGALIGAAILRLALPLHGTAPVVATAISGVCLALGLYAFASAGLQTKY